MFNNTTYEKQIEAINKVRNTFPETEFPDVWQEGVFYGTKDTKLWDDKNVVVGRYKGMELPYAMVSNQYKLLTHEECIDAVMDIILPSLDMGESKTKIKFAGEGARLFASFDFPETTDFNINGDNYYPRLILKNSYDTELVFSISWDIVRQICSNGAVVVGRKGRKTSQRHRMAMDEMEIIESIKDDLLNVHDFCDFWKENKSRVLDIPEFTEIWTNLPFGSVKEDEEVKRENHRTKLLALPIVGSGMTLNEYIQTGKIPFYEMHNAVTQFVTHNISSPDVQNEKMVVVERVFRKAA